MFAMLSRRTGRVIRWPALSIGRGFLAILIQLSAALVVSAQPIRLEIDPRYSNRPGGGIYVTARTVISGGLADRLGIKASERIELIDGQRISSPDQLASRLAAGPPLVLSVRNPVTKGIRDITIPQPGAPPIAGIGGPVVNGAGGGQVANGQNAALRYRLTNEFLGSSRSLESDPQGRVSMAPSNNAAGQRWFAVADSTGKFRIFNELLGPQWSLASTANSDYPTMKPTDASSLRQMWRVAEARDGFYQIVQQSAGVEWALDNEQDGPNTPVLAQRGENGGQLWKMTQLGAAVPVSPLVGTWAEYLSDINQPSGVQITIGPDLRFIEVDGGIVVSRGIVQLANNRLTLARDDGTAESFRFSVGSQRIDFLRVNGTPEVFYWRAAGVGLGVAPVVVPDLRPRLISRQVVPNEPLEPVNVVFSNSHDLELWLIIRDTRAKNAAAELKIPAGQAKPVELERDAGSTAVESWEIPLRSGEVQLEQRRIPIPPRQIYQVSVYELFRQSIAIDGTKKGKGKVEDVNYSPKSVGKFPIPAGATLTDSTVDVYNAARRQKNPGAVELIDPKDWQSN
jgi:hypothetical protein